jgi:His-Xaa-Ser system radical SAM maturase HxsC
MFGIPLYADVSEIHDFVVQADGAFDETIRGVLNLKRCRQKVEIRVVLHKQTYERLPNLAQFISRNLLFVDQVVLMGLEITGFTKANFDALWIDPIEYVNELSEAVQILQDSRVNVRIYNHPLCVLPPHLHSVSVKSISDWKNEYQRECEPCTRKQECGGFFATSKRPISESIKPFLAN